MRRCGVARVTSAFAHWHTLRNRSPQPTSTIGLYFVQLPVRRESPHPAFVAGVLPRP